MGESERTAITAIEPQVKRPDRVSIFVEGEFCLGVHAEVAITAGLRVGQTVNVPELQALARSEEKRQARDSALRLLGYRARSRSELKQRLERKGYDPELIEETLELLHRGGFIDDAEFSRAWVRSRTGARPMGPTRIAAELRQKGVERELIQDALEPVSPETQLNLALAVGRRKAEQLHGEDVRVARRKLSSALMRRGFTSDVCAKVLDIVLRAEE
jgi:regulatory protein